VSRALRHSLSASSASVFARWMAASTEKLLPKNPMLPPIGVATTLVPDQNRGASGRSGATEQVATLETGLMGDMSLTCPPARRRDYVRVDLDGCSHIVTPAVLPRCMPNCAPATRTCIRCEVQSRCTELQPMPPPNLSPSRWASVSATRSTGVPPGSHDERPRAGPFLDPVRRPESACRCLDPCRQTTRRRAPHAARTTPATTARSGPR
jgi:hypothetical protein